MLLFLQTPKHTTTYKSKFKWKVKVKKVSKRLFKSFRLLLEGQDRLLVFSGWEQPEIFLAIIFFYPHALFDSPSIAWVLKQRLFDCISKLGLDSFCITDFLGNLSCDLLMCWCLHVEFWILRNICFCYIWLFINERKKIIFWPIGTYSLFREGKWTD